MALNFLKKRWQKLLLTAALLFLILVSIPAFFINQYWSPILADKLRSTVLNSTDSLYSLNFSKASLHVLQGKLVIDQIELKPNIEVYNRRKKQNLAPNSLYDLQVKRLVINHVHPFKLYFDNKLDINQIVISSPNLHVNYEQNRNQDTVITGTKTPYQLISKLLKSVHVQSIILDDIKFKYSDHRGRKVDISEFKELNFNATDFLLDSISQLDKTRFLFCKDLSVELNNYEGTSYDKRYQYKIKYLTFSTQTSQLNMTGMSFLPVNGPKSFLKTTKSDCFSLKLDSLRLTNFNFKLYSKYHTVYASSLILKHAVVQVFSNPAPRDTIADASVNYPYILLQKLKPDLRIDTIDIQKTDISYTEYYEKSGQQGTLNFANTNGLILNVTNNKPALQKNNTATAQLYSYFMGYGKFDVQFAFNLTNANAPFSYKGHLGAMDLKKINPIAAPLGLVKISSGKLNSFDFNMHANLKTARGTVKVLYNDLKISLLKKDGENKLKKMGIVSWLANALVIKRNNPSDNEPPRSFVVAYPRKKSMSMFGYMWKSLFMGLKSSAGYDADTEKTVKQKMSDFQKNKPGRQAKKILRKQHRAERRLRREQRRHENLLKKQQEKQTQ